MKTPIFTGSCTAIVTPFTDNGIDYNKMGELIDFQIEGNTSAIVVCGTTGENATQPVEEHMKLVEYCVNRAAGRIKIISGVGSNDTSTALTLSTHAEKAGVDGILMVTPYYNKTSQAGLVKHFSYVADRVNVPMILYNVPGRTGIGITADTYKILSQHPNINGIKEASGDFSLFSQTRAIVGDDLFVWSGNDDNTVPMMALGAIGVISVASNIIPGQVAQMCDLALRGDFKAAAAMHLEWADLFSKLFIEVNPIPVKTAMNLMGMNVGKFRLPLYEMGEGTLKILKDCLKAHSLID